MSTEVLNPDRWSFSPLDPSRSGQERAEEIVHQIKEAMLQENDLRLTELLYSNEFVDLSTRFNLTVEDAEKLIRESLKN